METDEPSVIDESDLEELSSDALTEDDLDGDDVLDVEDDLDIEDLDEDVDAGTDDPEDDPLAVDLDAALVPDSAAKPAKPKTKGDRHDDEEDDDDDEEVIDEDVEASLDVILKERLVVDDDEDEDEVIEADDRSDSVTKVLPKQPDEFVCQSCFLVKHPSQLADPGQMLCRDCV
ncbi:MAG: DUF4193 family protein [Acidimicrobiales bacterium]